MKHSVTLTLTGDADFNGNGIRTRYEPITAIGEGNTFALAFADAQYKLKEMTLR